MSFNSASSYTSLPVQVPMCDAWGYLSVGSSVSSISNSQLSGIVRDAAGRYRVNFANPSRFPSSAYVAITTPEFRTDSDYGTNYGPVRVAIPTNNSGATGINSANASSATVNTYTYVGFHVNGGTAQIADHAANTTRVGFAAFSFSRDNTLYNSSLTATNFSTVPGACGYGVTGATYNSHLTNMSSERTASAYGTIVIPGYSGGGTATPVGAYVEHSLNVLGVSAGGNSVFDITFNKPMNNTNYCVILSGEYETAQTSLTDTFPSTNEVSELIVRAGSNGQFKTINGFRIESLKQSSTNNGWTNQSVVARQGLTERIHFMVFGGVTYGQP